MKWRGLVMLTAGLLLAADAIPGRGDEKAKEEEYAKVELKGVLGYRNEAIPRAPRVPAIWVANQVYELDLSEHPELKGQVWEKLEGKRAIVTGTLTVPIRGGSRSSAIRGSSSPLSS
jgi:hypothetical protein